LLPSTARFERGHNFGVWILRSYRWRRRLIAIVVLVGVVGPAIYLGIHLSTPGDPGNATGPEVPGYSQPKKAPFTPAKQRAVRRVLAAFIRNAVARQDVARSWNLAAASLKQGVTRKQWNRGDIPVVPYPALDKGLGTWDLVNYSYRDTVGLEVLLFPQPGSGYAALTADVELVRNREGQWRVDYWMPKKFHGPPALAKGTAKPKPKHHAKAAGKRRYAPKKAQPTSEPGPTRETTRPSRGWWAVPIALLSLIVVVPFALWIVTWRRNRKATLEYERWHRRTEKDTA
jgi:hypothetical protein